MFLKVSRIFFSHTCWLYFEQLCFISETIFTFCYQLLLLLSSVALLNSHLPPNLSFMAYISSTACHWFFFYFIFTISNSSRLSTHFAFFLLFYSTRRGKSQQVYFSVIRILSLHPTQAEIPQAVPHLCAAIIFTDKKSPIDCLVKLRDH